MRKALLVLGIFFCLASSAVAQVSIGITFSTYPQLVRVPGYPVYYAPQANSNYFFYDGLYWVYQGDNWYESSWYNGPWTLVPPEAVPLYVLRVPVRYYRAPPSYFRAWRSDAPPRWGEHWGRDWEQRRSGWDRWNRNAAPAPAPLPSYQRQYSGNRYPPPEQQRSLHEQRYRYQPRDADVRPRYQQQGPQQGSQPQQGSRAQQGSRPPEERQRGQQRSERPGTTQSEDRSRYQQ